MLHMVVNVRFITLYGIIIGSMSVKFLRAWYSNKLSGDYSEECPYSTAQLVTRKEKLRVKMVLSKAGLISLTV